MKDSEILEAAKDLIEDPQHWCRFHRHVQWWNADDDTLVDQYCAVGALETAVGKQRGSWADAFELRRFLDGIAMEHSDNPLMGIMAFNDSLVNGGHDAVIQVFEKAIAMKQEVGQ